jgi:hypothetical protein
MAPTQTCWEKQWISVANHTPLSALSRQVSTFHPIPTFGCLGRPTTNGPIRALLVGQAFRRTIFDVFKIPLVRGRYFNVRDDAASAPVVIINQALAKQFWPKSDPLKDQIVIGKNVGPEFSDLPRQIMGVVGDWDAGLGSSRRRVHSGIAGCQRHNRIECTT